MLPYIDIYPLQDKAEFEQAVRYYSQKLGIRPEWLMAVMHFETAGTMNPGIQNSIGATGLIQFMPNTAIGLGTTVDALKKMTGSEQMYWVHKYLSPYQNKIKSLADLYMAVFYPLAISRGQEFVLGSQNNTADTVARQNPSFSNGRDYVTKQDVTNFITYRYPEISKYAIDVYQGVKKRVVDVATMVTANPVAFGLTASGIAMIVLYFGFISNRK